MSKAFIVSFLTSLFIGIFGPGLNAVESNCSDINYLADRLTIITTTSPIRSNPSTAIIEASMESLFSLKELRSCRKIIVFDGVGPDVKYQRKDIQQVEEDYKRFKENMIALTQDPSKPHFKNTVLLFLEEFSHQAWALQKAMELVDTPYIYSHQHDIVITRPFDAIGIV